MIILRWFLTESARDYWIKNYSQFNPRDSIQGHWGEGQTGFNISESGRIYLSDNVKFKDDFGEYGYPNHRDLIVGSGKDETIHSGIYSWTPYKGEIATLWLYPFTEEILNNEMKKGLASLIGVHKIIENTPVYSNTGRRDILFRLGDVV